MNPEIITHLGKVIGQWPTQAFNDEQMASRWAAEDPINRRVWEVLDITLGPMLIGEAIPARSVLKPIGTTLADQEQRA